MASPKISIIVPVYNVEKYIRRCLDSIAVQTFTDWECICVDDGTPDASGKICNEYAQKDSRFVVIHKENGGVSSARNVGLDVAKGEYVTFCDSDDYVERNWLSSLYEQAIFTNSDIVNCDLIRKSTKSDYTQHQVPGLTGKETVKKLMTGDFDGYLWIKLIKRSLIEDNFVRFSENFDLWEDIPFSIKLYYHSKKNSYLPKSLYNYWVENENSYTSIKNEKSFSDMDKAVNEVHSFLIKMPDYQIFNDFENYLKFKVLQQVVYTCKDIEIKKQYLKKYSEIKILKLKKIKLHLRLVVYFEQKDLFLISSIIKIFYKFLKGIKNFLIQRESL